MMMTIRAATLKATVVPNNLWIIKMLKYLIIFTTFINISGCTSLTEQKSVGGGRDENGCITSAGYSWDPTKQKCVRPWEVNSSNADD
jgi:hypothetical protein